MPHTLSRYSRSSSVVLMVAVLGFAVALGDCSGNSVNVTTNGTAPSITTQPTNQSVAVGQSATFTVVAAGTPPLSYQWQKGTTNISGANAASYTTPATKAGDSGSTFRVIVSNGISPAATSNSATLTVTSAPQAPTITTQPTNQSVAVGQSATFTVVAAGTPPLSYQWQKGTSNISGATSASYTTPATTLTDNGSTFRVIVSNGVSPAATSNSATLTVTSAPPPSNVSVLTYHNDNMRSGLNSNETALSLSNVNQTQFGKLFSDSLDGLAFASPLYVGNVNIPGQGAHNVVYIATENDTVYAYDADGRSTTPLWKVSFLNSGATTVPCGDTGECGDIPNQIGISGTPVIDASTGTLYVVANTEEGTSYVQRLHALDITTGAEKFGGPVVIQASVPGTGSGSVNNQVAFDPLRENQRAALLLSNGVVYIGWSAHGDQQPWHGWIMGYNATTLQQTMAQCVSPNGYGAGIWMSNGGPAADSTGNLYFATGNGDFTANTGGTDYGDTILKLSPSGSVLDYFTPFDQSNMEGSDLDLGSAGPVLLLDQSGAIPHVLIAAGKTGTVYVVNRDNMGKYNASNQIIQTLQGVLPNGNLEEGNFSAPVYFNGNIYFGAVNDNLKSFQFSGGQLTSVPGTESPEISPNRGASFAVSANGTSNGILWAVQDNSPSNGVLYAYDASNLTHELYNSSQAAGSRDSFGVATKFSIPLVANGKVYVVADGQLVAFGLLP